MSNSTASKPASKKETDLLNAALTYAAQGWRVFPLHGITNDLACTCGGQDCEKHPKKRGKHPRTKNGFKDATTDEATIRKWWGQWPDANIGIATGSGMFVLDQDGITDDLPEVVRNLPPTLTAKTGRPDGKHHYFRCPEGKPIKSPAKLHGLPVDIRGEDGYVVAPPSKHYSGNLYQWDDPNAEVAEAPAALLEWIHAAKSRPKGKGEELPRSGSRFNSRTPPAGDVEKRALAYLAKMPGAISGQGGHPMTFKAARVVVYGFDLGAERGFDLLWNHYNPHCDPPWTEKELRHKCDEADTKPFDKRRGWLLDEDSPRAGANGKHHANANGKHEARPDDDGRPVILVDVAMGRVCDEATEALATDGNLFSRGGGLVQCCQQANGLTLHEVKVPLLRKKMAQTAEFVNRSGHNVFAPLWAAQAIAMAGEWPALRHLTAAVEHPYFNGERVVVEEGYDPKTGILLRPNVTLPNLPTRPTLDDARAACGRLLDLVQDFPFQKDYHRSTWLAYVMALACRHAIAGSVPLFLFDASTPGSGKDMLAIVGGLIVHGRKPDMRPPTFCDNEFRKTMLAVAMAGDPVWIQSNVQHVIGGPTLDAAITASIWKDRQLGETKLAGAAVKLVFVATGNNLAVKGDTPRRVAICRLTPDTDRPEERRNFHHPNLLAHVERERPQLLTDVHTLLLAYHQAGRPEMGLPPWGSFEGFTALVRNCIVWIGQPDPYEGREDLRRFTGGDTEVLANVLAALHELDPHCRGLTAAEILADLNGSEIKELLVDVAADRSGELTAKSVGKWFSAHKDRIAGGLRLAVTATRKGGRLAWAARPMNTKEQAAGDTESF